MQKLLLFAILSTLVGCGVGTGSVKERWTQNLKAYSFVPMYPAREGVDIGDIRVHRFKGASATFDSRLLWDWKVDHIVGSQPKAKTAILPGVEVVRLYALDVSSIGLKGLLTRMFGTRFEATETIHVVLKDIKTSEISDVHVAKNFIAHLQRRLQVPPKPEINDLSADVIGFCAAAITFKYARLEEIQVSIVTRTVSIGGITYATGRGFSNVEGKSSPSATAAEPGSLDGQSGAALTSSHLISDGNGIPEGQRVVIGVDALTLKPAKFIDNLETACGVVGKYYDTARLHEFY